MYLSGDLVVIATTNQGKVKEFAHLFKKLGMEVASLSDFPHMPEVIEDGATFAENAFKKARILANQLNRPVLADDSGLRVHALGGAPGIYSARYSGEQATAQENNEKLLIELHKVYAESRNHADNSTQANGTTLAEDMSYDEPHLPSGLLSKAEYVCALALVDPQTNETYSVEAACPGFIAAEPRGAGGFGYDPLFYLPQFDKTMAEITLEVKNQISHRALAIQQLLAALAPNAGR